MAQSTFSVQVANKYLTILQGYSKTIRLLLVMFLTLTITTNAWAETVTYTVSSTSAVTKSGTAPDGSSATYKSTYTNAKCQLTANNSMTLTLSGYDGCKITGLTLSMKSNSSKGSGNMSMEIGNTTISSIATAKFSNNTWNGSWSTSYVNVTPSVTATTVGNGEKIVITIAATENSLYCQSFTITYETSGGSVTPDPCTTPTVAWNTKPANGEVGDSMTASVTTNYSNGLTYSSSNQTVATVTNAGVINYLAAGTTTITAIVTGDGTTFCEGPVSVQQEITVTAPAGGGGGEGECSWKETAIGNIEDDDIVVITMTTSNGTTYAMSNDKGAGSAPAATTVTVSSSTLTGNIADNLKWNISNSNGTLTIYPNETTSTWLYCTSTNNGVRVGTNENKTFTIDATSGYLKNEATSRYVGVYTTNPDWRCYTSSAATNIANQTLKFYVYKCDGGGGDEPTPTKLDKPTNLKVSDVTTTTVTLSWDAVANANGYTVVVGSTSHNTNTPSITVENLTASTTYKWSVTAKGNGSTYTDSDAANGSDFTTKTTAPTNYTVTLNPNYPAGKTGTFKDKEENTVNGNLEISLPANTESQKITNLYSSISLEGYIFEGWYEAADGNANRTNTGTNYIKKLIKKYHFYASDDTNPSIYG